MNHDKRETTRWKANASATVLSLVEHLREAPQEEWLRGVLADVLETHGLTPVERNELPHWFFSYWRRHIPAWRNFGGPRSKFGVLWEVQEVLSGEETCRTVWDHWGRTTIADMECLVTEPYGLATDAPLLFAPLERLLPSTVAAYTRWGSWNNGTIRGLLFPPLLILSPRR